MSSSESVVKPHDIITARYKLTAREQDLVTLAFMEVKRFADRTKVKLGVFDVNRPESLNDIPTIFVFDADRVASLMGVSLKALVLKDRDTGCSMLQSVCSRLVSRKVEAEIDGGSWLVAGLISEAKFTNNKLTLEVTRSQAARMLNYGLKAQSFGIVDARLLLGLKSAYAKRILELISRFKNARDFTTTVGDLCEMLGTSLDEHADFARFRRTVIDRSLAQIVSGSKGVWISQNGYPKGYEIDTGRGRKVTELTQITFKMSYVELGGKPIEPDSSKAKTKEKMPPKTINEGKKTVDAGSASAEPIMQGGLYAGSGGGRPNRLSPSERFRQQLVKKGKKPTF
ncbi:replication initiation protein [Vibrio sp. 10N.261.46.A3]|uniref:replication initiation protein n=1 Tax=Vibrio sp. 10N.261.46.A3 TaxID=3229658 RepID=UPI0035534700